jgi:formylglycine-generating enzyme required for sulfatase activity
MSEEDLARHAWFAGNSEASTHAPGSLEASTLGIHDMLGNVAEWVTDTGEQRIALGGHFRAPASETTGTAESVEDESWNENYPNEPKSIWWFVDAPYVGFRLVCEPGPAAPAGEQPPATVKE